MKTGRKVNPGQPGTKKLQQKYGDNLVCVRYRYDSQKKMRLKTIELVIERAPWQPSNGKIPMDRVMQIRIEYSEVTLRKQVKAAGGLWDKQEKVWELPYKEVLRLGLNDRIKN